MESVYKTLGLVLVVIITGFVTYWRGRRAKIDEIRIERVLDLVEKISIAIQDVHRTMEHLGWWFEENFKNLDSVAEGVDRFRDGANTIYTSSKDDVEQLARDKATLGTLVKEGQVYLPKQLLTNLAAYMETCAFQYSNVWPLFDTHLERLFENILDSEKRSTRNSLNEEIMKGLRKVRS